MSEASKPFCYQYAHPALGIDCLILRIHQHALQLLTIRRGSDPYKGTPSLPGGFFDFEDEDIEHTAHRELMEETGLEANLHLLGPYSAKDRDPRERTISVAWWGMAVESAEPKAGDDAASVEWLDPFNLPQMAFDHNQMIADLMGRLKAEPEKYVGMQPYLK